MIKLNILIVSMIFTLSSLFGQNSTQKASTFGKMEGPILIPSIAQQIEEGTFIGVEPLDSPKEAPPKRRGANKHVPGKGFPKGNDPLVEDQVKTKSYEGREPTLVFDAAVSNFSVSDPTGAAGPDHFIGAWNTGFRIFDKEGNPLTNEASLATLFPGNAIGDPIVFYDAEADRFVITEFDGNPNGFNMAVCQGPDPVNDGWYIYTTGFETGSFPDYTKFSVWSDGYYVTANINAGNKVFAVERDEMLLGNESQFVGFPLTGVSTSGFYSPQFLHVTNDDLPAPGNATVIYMQDDAWSGVNTDHLKLWSVNVDWDDVESSTISAPAELETSPFIGVFDGGSFSNVPQLSGPDQDVLQATIMNQAQFRKFSGYNSAIFNFVVDTDGSSGELAGIRWFELRQDDDGEPWSIYQEGTYISPYEDKHAFSGSMAMDQDGNIGMGYTTCSENHRIAIYYTGRFANDELGQMTVDETLIAQSTANNPGNRLADYVHLTVDPTNDKTFWHIAEYFVNNQRTDVVGVFQIAPDFANDVGVVSIDAPVDGSLSDADTVKITLRNFGGASQFDIPVSYKINDGSVVTELFTDTIQSSSNAQYAFIATGDFSIVGENYQITSFTDLSVDEYPDNDTAVASVTHLYPNDLGIVKLDSPQSGSELTENEMISITLENAGGEPQSDFEVTFVLDDEDPVTEQVVGPIESSSNLLYTFDATGDFSALGDHYLTIYTSLNEDADTSNDTIIEIITNEICQPFMDCTQGDGIARLELGTIVNPSGCNENGYGDYTDMTTNLWPGATDELIITTNYGSQYVKVWIDLNDNFIFETDEIIIDDHIIAEGQGGGTYTDFIPFPIPGNEYLGEHLMRAKTNWNAPVPDNACEGTEYGETEDYTVNIDNTTGIYGPGSEPNELVVSEIGDDKFLCRFKAVHLEETLIITVHNVSGQTMLQNRVDQVNGWYQFDFDMSYAPPGMYLVRLGSDTFGKVKKILVR